MMSRRVEVGSKKGYPYLLLVMDAKRSPEERQHHRRNRRHVPDVHLRVRMCRGWSDDSDRIQDLATSLVILETGGLVNPMRLRGDFHFAGSVVKLTSI